MSAFSQVCTREHIVTDKYIVLTVWEFRSLCKFGEADISQYGWGHAGPAYFTSREIIQVETLGL